MILEAWFMLLVVCTEVDFSVGQETSDERVSGCGDSKHNHEDGYDRMETELRQQISNSNAMLQTQVTELEQDLEGLKEQIRDLQSNVTTEMKRRGSEQEERLRNISATSAKDVQFLKFICSAGIIML